MAPKPAPLPQSLIFRVGGETRFLGASGMGGPWGAASCPQLVLLQGGVDAYGSTLYLQPAINFLCLARPWPPRHLHECCVCMPGVRVGKSAVGPGKAGPVTQCPEQACLVSLVSSPGWVKRPGHPVGRLEPLGRACEPKGWVTAMWQDGHGSCSSTHGELWDPRQPECL